MKRIAIVIIGEKEVEISKLPADEKKEIVNALNRRALEAVGYREIKTA